MKKLGFIAGTACLFFMASCDSPEEMGGCEFAPFEAYELVWSDEFEGTEVDTSKWTFEIGTGCQYGPDLCGWGNNELQYYTDRQINVRVIDGNLRIRARRENPLYLGEHRFTSARMHTQANGDWKYGRMDIRARMPIGLGLWPAIWMLPSDTVYGIWPRSGEIDIMEYLGDNPRRVLASIHWGHDRHRFETQYFDLPTGAPNFHEQWHVFTCIWTEDCILFQIDGQDVGPAMSRSTTLPSTWPFDQYFHMILNVAVGGNLTGNVEPTAQFPQDMLVDYVRVYQLK